jgi:hypothetical protein
MSTVRLNKLVGQAIVSENFRAKLLNGQRARLLAEWELEPVEAQSILSIRAGNLEEFAQGICRILETSPHTTGVLSA